MNKYDEAIWIPAEEEITFTKKLVKKRQGM
jgi:hypothetical protein